MKIGIITIQKSEVNFGACLQSYALWKFITSLGYDCEVIDLLRPCHATYEISKSFGEHKSPLKNRIYHTLKELVPHGTTEDYSLAKYREFNYKVKYSKQYRSVAQLYRESPYFDVLISGSDQIWNPQMPFINAPYFLTFADTKSKKISYASSFGIPSIPDNVKNNYKKWLLEYQHISTREKSGAEIVEGLLGNKATVVLDPVFLLEAKDWMKEMKACEGLCPKKYVFVYMLKYNAKVMTYANTIAKQKQLPLYFVISEKASIQTEFGSQLLDVGPAEWLWSIANADTLITTSFHGSAFGIIFKTPLAVIMRNGVSTNTRIEDLFSILGICNHIIDEDTASMGADKHFEFDDSVESILRLAKTNSIEYLKAAIEK